MLRTTRIALIVVLALMALPAAAAKANPRMQIGFFDDPSFRWSKSTAANLESASKTGASIMHVLADWSQIAASKPASPLNGDDPAYKISDLDALVRTAPKYGLQVMITPEVGHFGTIAVFLHRSPPKFTAPYNQGLV